MTDLHAALSEKVALSRSLDACQKVQEDLRRRIAQWRMVAEQRAWEVKEARDVALCAVDELPPHRQRYYRTRGYPWLREEAE